MSRIAFVVVCGLGAGLLAKPPAALAGCNSGSVGATDLLGSANCQASAAGPNATAVGALSNASGPLSTAVGFNAVAQGISGSAFGRDASANGEDSVAIGANAFTNVGPVGAVAIGASATAQGNAAVSMGNGANAFSSGSVALGGGAQSANINATAVGVNSNASGNSAIAMGSGSTAAFANSAAIGNGATTTRVNQQSFGTATNTYTMSGITSAASTAAQTGPISVVTTDAAGNLATISSSSLATVGTVAALDGRVTSLENNVQNLNFQVRKAFEGAAVAIAMGGSALPDNKRFAISANWGNFSGENAFGGMAQMRISNNFVANAAIGAGFARGGIGGRVGGTFAW